MQTLDKYNSNLGTAIALVGPAGSGKTVLGMRLFPNTYVVVADLNFTSGLRYLQAKNELSGVLGFDTISVDENGKLVLPLHRYDRFWKCLNDAATNPKVDAIFVDSATFVTEFIIAKLVNATEETKVMIPPSKESRNLWGLVGVTWRGLIAQIRSTGKKFIIAVHEKKDQDESDSIWKHEFLIPGQTKDLLPNLVSDVWRCEVSENNKKHTWMVRTLPNARMENLKNTYGLPYEISADDLVKKVRETK